MACVSPLDQEILSLSVLVTKTESSDQVESREGFCHRCKDIPVTKPVKFWHTMDLSFL